MSSWRFHSSVFTRNFERIAYEDQKVRIRVFWELLAQKSGDFQIIGDKLFAGDYLINGNYETPGQAPRRSVEVQGDHIHERHQGSTNVMKADGTRAIVTTRLTGPAYDCALQGGRSFRGKVVYYSRAVLIPPMTHQEQGGGRLSGCCIRAINAPSSLPPLTVS